MLEVSIMTDTLKCLHSYFHITNCTIYKYWIIPRFEQTLVEINLKFVIYLMKQ